MPSRTRAYSNRSSRSTILNAIGSFLPGSKSATVPVPPAPSALLSNPRETYSIQRPIDKNQDSPLGTIYRIYWAIVMDDTISMRNEIEYFWLRKEKSWKVYKIPQPPDQDPQRFAIVSAIPFILAAAFNRLINLGLPRDAATGILTTEELDKLKQRPKVLENVPEWATNAPPLPNPLRLITEHHGAPQTAEVEGTDPYMALKNVLVWRLHIFFT